MKEMEIIKKLLNQNPLLLLEILLEKNSAFNFSPLELLILQYLWLNKTKNQLNLSNSQLAELTRVDESEVRTAIGRLIKSQYIDLNPIEKNGKISEEYDLSPIINKCFDATITQIKPTNSLQQFVGKIEIEFSRKLSPIEIQYIQTWVYDEHISIEILEEALRETVLAGVRNFKYMSAIINNWQTNNTQNNFTTKQQMKTAFQKSKTKEFSAEEKEIAKIDWETVLNEDI